MQKWLILAIISIYLNCVFGGLKYLKPIEDECSSETQKIVSEAIFSYYEVGIFENFLEVLIDFLGFLVLLGCDSFIGGGYIRSHAA
jgi:hypothetical protein